MVCVINYLPSVLLVLETFVIFLVVCVYVLLY